MRKTKQTLLADLRNFISQPTAGTSDISDSALLGFMNEGVQFISTKIEWPRDIVSVQVEDDIPAYTLLTDTLKILTAYFGDQNVQGDVRPLHVVTEEKLNEYDSSWLDKTSSSKGTPNKIMLLDRNTILVHPRPNTTQSASGKKIYLNYVYYPAALSADGDIPDLPPIYHDSIKEYAAYLCYMGILKNPNLAKEILKTMLTKIEMIKPSVVSSFEEKYFGWGNYEGDSSSDSISNYIL